MPLDFQVIKVLKGHQGIVNTCIYNKEGNYVLSGGQDKQVKLWNPNTGLCIKSYGGHGWEVLSVAT